MDLQSSLDWFIFFCLPLCSYGKIVREGLGLTVDPQYDSVIVCCLDLQYDSESLGLLWESDHSHNLRLQICSSESTKESTETQLQQEITELLSQQVKTWTPTVKSIVLSAHRFLISFYRFFKPLCFCSPKGKEKSGKKTSQVSAKGRSRKSSQGKRVRHGFSFQIVVV